jgi:hypothetical protein
MTYIQTALQLQGLIYISTQDPIGSSIVVNIPDPYLFAFLVDADFLIYLGNLNDAV